VLATPPPSAATTTTAAAPAARPRSDTGPAGSTNLAALWNALAIEVARDPGALAP
jgi:hypothetical protein